jgi:hypothetical protein
MLAWTELTRKAMAVVERGPQEREGFVAVAFRHPHIAVNQRQKFTPDDPPKKERSSAPRLPI